MRLRRTILASLTALTVFAGSAAALSAARRPAVAPYRLSGVKAMLFYEHTGTFSGDLLAQRGIALWNTIIGEGDAREPSHSVLVVVQVSGEAGSSEDARRVELTATTEGNKVILRQAQELGILSARGRTHVGFWLYGVGCQRVRLRARLTGQPNESPRTAEIPFECGE